ncbi:MAG: hypothetical protein QW175_02820 [Candidatus Bathyarchaeia archaeon]
MSVKKQQNESGQIVKIIAILGLIAYGITLANLGLDSTIAMSIAAIVGGVAGYEIRKRRL